jgi:hypothetical protein
VYASKGAVLSLQLGASSFSSQVLALLGRRGTDRGVRIDLRGRPNRGFSW